MIGSLLTRVLVMMFGYAYPAYECFKSVEKNKPDIEQLRFWCQYWILVAVLTISERIADFLISWLPMYSEAKLAFYIYLWYPKTKGTAYVYESFFKPYISKHEPEIDRKLSELRTRAGDVAVLFGQRAATYAQTRVFDILQYIALQSALKPQSSQMQQAVAQQETKEPSPPAASSSDSGSNQAESGLKPLIATPKPSLAVTAKPQSPNKAKPTQTEPLGSPSSAKADGKPPLAPKETAMEEPNRAYPRSRLRKTGATVAQ